MRRELSKAAGGWSCIESPISSIPTVWSVASFQLTNIASCLIPLIKISHLETEALPRKNRPNRMRANHTTSRNNPTESWVAVC